MRKKELLKLRTLNATSKMMQMAIMAMREIGEKAITDEQIAKIKNIIKDAVSEDDFNHDIVLTPIWIRKILQR